MPIYIDQMRREIEIPEKPQRIISLVPSQTELLFELGLEAQIVGITKFCVHPADLCAKKTKIGGTKKFDFERMAALKPDLIIGNKEENYKEGIDQLSLRYPVWMSDIQTLSHALEMIQNLGEITGKAENAKELILEIQKAFDGLQDYPKQEKSTAYFIWQKPYMVAGDDTFINHLLGICGFSNVFGGRGRYPEITEKELVEIQPELILLSSEPFPFKQKHLEELQMFCPQSQIILVDGEMFSWYGSRLLPSAIYLKNLQKSVW